MDQPLNQKPDNSDPKELVFGSLGGLPKIVQRIIDKNQNNIPDVIENIDVKKLKINGKSFNNWNEVVAEFKKIKSSSVKGQPLDIQLNGNKIDQKKPPLVTIGKNRQKPDSPSQPFLNDKPKPIKVGGSFTFIKILLALAAIVAIIYYIYKLAS